MTDEQQTIDERPPFAPEPWLDDDAGELPPRPRRRLLTPLPLALLAALAIACGFIGGVLVEKGQGSSTREGSGASAAGLSSRLATLRGAGSTSTSGSGSASARSSAGAGSGSSGVGSSSAGVGGGGEATVGQVAYVSHGALYVTTLEGDTVKVTAAPGATVTRSVKTTTSHIHPGETVVVTGAPSASGAIAAQSIRAGSTGTGGFGGAGAALFGGERASGGSARASGGGTSPNSGSGEQALFGKG